ncbi:hypothetical protein LTS10_012027 [Elasticomyces elasticus]|nr:hypothetical protein LTS10_012027 [Elasticomyces elasticus]
MISTIQPSDSISIGLEATTKDSARNDEMPAKHRVKLTDFPHELLLKIFGYVIAGTNPEADCMKRPPKRFGFALTGYCPPRSTDAD